ncbi:MAG: hypothetical protein Hyperionvirus3_24 [Hyperionvirus sp.]|uniref:Uncharacterized protein n=1 Tax=Hyperionvirus sp. TaxID=2487770 RepID=A0A3G5A6S3_9VIRU|nr:MAG: hypothetical protein Hyperionvirus3_24 [Hyperionvirus sp.]
MAYTLVGFCIESETQHPVYEKLCLRCQKPLPEYGSVLSLETLKYLDRTPEEILGLSESEKAIMRSKLPTKWKKQSNCPCSQHRQL